jgi:hypothetical protein
MLPVFVLLMSELGFGSVDFGMLMAVFSVESPENIDVAFVLASHENPGAK